MIGWISKSYLGPAEIATFVYFFSLNPGERGEHLAIGFFMFLVLIKGMRRGGESKIPIYCPRGLRAFLQIYRERGSVI